MKLIDLLDGIKFELIQGSLNLNIENIEFDSREVIADTFFACEKGLTTDGHKYALKAIAKGATALLVEYIPEGIPREISIIKVKNTPLVMPKIANKFAREPWREMAMVGVTGTNGKSSIVNLLSNVLEAYEKKVGLIGTIENKIGSRVVPAKHTTPMPFDLQKLLREMKNEDVDAVAMEVSSHALALGRVGGMHFNIGAFTNLTLDHLDYHKTMENYLEAKAMLFRVCDKGIFNIDDPHVGGLLKDATCEVITYSIEKEADYRATDINITAEGVSYTLLQRGLQNKIFVPIPGKFSVYNSLAVIAIAHTLGLPLSFIIKTLSNIEGVRGRFQSMTSQDGFSVIVDYAHSPDGLRNVLQTVNEFVKGKVITVFGCGGDRDNSKRPVMGEVAGKHSDFCVVTSDNPRTEEPNSILDQIEPGVKKTDCEYVKIVDRKEAIQYAIDHAKKDDVIMIAGKGHEDYQIIGHKKIHFDDVEIVKELIEKK